MAEVITGRQTATVDEDVVVFLIGMRINRLRRIRSWLPAFRAMPRMLRELAADPSLGLLGVHSFWMGRTILAVQYWRSFEDLERFARHPSDPHLAAWKKFNQAVGADGSVGIWHETYMVHPDQFESVYGNMPRFGLAAAMEHVEAVGRRYTARKRLETNKTSELAMETQQG